MHNSQSRPHLNGYIVEIGSCDGWLVSLLAGLIAEVPDLWFEESGREAG
jgi:hypothetical protein